MILDEEESLKILEFKKIRLSKIEKIKELGIDPYPSKFDKSFDLLNIQNKYEYLKDGEVTEDKVNVAGRIMSIRNDGMFIDLKDSSGRIQIFCHKNNLDEKNLALKELLDIGDMIGIEGIVRRTPRGELTINAQNISFLSKSLLPLPEKYHGLHDTETRFRKRYLDFIMNDEAKETFKKRCETISNIRNFLLAQDFLEVETPMLHPIPGGALAKPFITHHNALDLELYLRIAPELYLKKLIIGGVSDKIFELNRCFRNEGISPRHNPEFTTIEIYQSYADYNIIMDLTEDIVINCVKSMLKEDIID